MPYTQNTDEPANYNAAEDLVGRNLCGERRKNIAVIDRDGSYTYEQLDNRINRFASLLENRCVEREQRILLCLLDTVDFPACFLGAIKAGVVPVPVNTLLTSEDYAYMLADSRAKMLVVSEELWPAFKPHAADHPELKHILISGQAVEGREKLTTALEQSEDQHQTAATRPDDIAFWLYTSGTTGRPKGAMHYQTDLIATAQTYCDSVLALRAGDTVFSAAKLFFAYGLGNALTFPFAVGATAVLMAGRPTPQSVQAITTRHRPTIFFGVPTLYAMMLNSNQFPETDGLRLCISAGEALPANVFSRWHEATGLTILDGIGSTEMLHIFLSNTEDHTRPGTSGRAVPGYDLEIRDENGLPVEPGELGDLFVSGPSSAAGYWSLRQQTRHAFQGEWVFTGDKYRQDEDGYYIHCARSDDLLKVGGIYVSPGEVENALIGHNAVIEAAVVGAKDSDQLTKPKAFVVLDENIQPSEALIDELIQFVRDTLADYKRPRWIEFLPELPKTATGKIQRYKLRATD